MNKPLNPSPAGVMAGNESMIVELETEKRTFRINVKFYKKSYNFSVDTVDGEVIGDYKSNLRTVQLTFFDEYSDAQQQRLFNRIRKEIEKWD